ncbi:MAG: chemotaxis protein CheW [Coleofasciculaceae cyanobacterium]
MSNFLSIPNTLASTSDASLSDANEQFLRFHLVPETTAIISILQLTEVLTIPVGEVVPIAHMPSWVMGVYNWRGDILWIVDLGHLIGLTPWHQQALNTSVYRAIVLKTGEGKSSSGQVKSKMLGLVVNRVEDIELCNPDLIQSPPPASVNPSLLSFLRGYYVKPDGEILVALEGEAIINGIPQ